MARQRFIHPEFWTDPILGQLSVAERLLFAGCFSNADDEGRLIANPAFLRSTIFPYDDFPVSEVKQMRDRMVYACKNLVLYLVDGQEYLTFLKWNKWQKPKYPKPSKLPAPPSPSVGDNQEKDRVNLGETFPQDYGNNGETFLRGMGRDGMGWVGMGRGGMEESPTKPTTVFVFEKEFGRLLSPMEIEQIVAMEDESNAEIVTEALRRSVARGKLNLRYIQTILNDWRKKNLRTIREVLDYEAAFEQKKNQNKEPPQPEKIADQLQRDKKRFDEMVNAAVFGIQFELDGLEDKSPDNIRAVINMPKLAYDPEVKKEALKRLNLRGD